MNLFNLFEGAIDDLETRRIEDLNAKMDDLTTRAKASTDPKVKEALRQEFAKAKAERDSYYKVNVEEAPGAETLSHNQSTDQSNLNALDLGEGSFTSDTNYTYTVFIDGTKEGTYGSQEEARAVVRRKKEIAPGRDYRIKPKARTSTASIKKFYNNRNRDVDESLKVSPHDAGMHAALKGKSYDSNPHPKGSPEHLLWSKGHNAMRARKAQDLDEHGGGVNDNGSYIAWRKKANKEHGITKAPKTVEEWKDSVPGEPNQDDLIKVEGWQDFNKVEPYAVCLAGKPIKQFNYYEEARRFHDNWIAKLYREGNKDKADKITLMPLDLDEVYTPAPAKPFRNPPGFNKQGTGVGNKLAQQTRAELAKKKEQGVAEARANDINFGHTVTSGSWIVYDPETKQIKKRFKTHTAGKSYAKTHGLSFASSEYYFDNVKQAVAEEFEPSPVASAIVRRIMFNHKDLLQTYGPNLVNAAVDEVADYVGDVDEIGSSDVSAWVAQVERMLKDNPPEAFDEASMKWASNKPTGPEFGGYLKGTDPAPNEYTNKGVGGCEESADENPIGEKELAYLITKAKGMKSKPDPELHKGDEHEINGDDQQVGEGINGNMTVRSNPLTQPLRARNFVAKNAIQSGAGKHANQLKKSAAAGRHAKHKGQLELDEMTNDEIAKIRKDAEDYATKQMTKPKQAQQPEKKKSFMQQVGDKQIGMVKGAWKGLTGQLEESDNFLTWAVRNGYNIAKPAIYESAKQAFTEIKKGAKDSNGFTKCWPGKHAEGTKKGKNGKPVRNCVPNESVKEAANPAQQAAIAIDKKKAVDETAAWQKKAGKNKNGGLNKKGVDSYRKEHPGSKLQTAVTKKPSKIKKGSKDDKRRKSFCARMSGMKGPMKKPNGEPTRKALSLRKWHCESIENLDVMLIEAISEAKNLGNRVKIVKGSEAGQMGTIGEIRPGAFKGAPGYYTVDLDNGSHIQVRKEALRLINAGALEESLRQGEYYVWTVYFDDGTSKRIKVTSDEFDPYEYYKKQNKVVVNVDYDWSIQGQ